MVDVVVVDCPPGAPGPLGRAAGMTLVERHVREALRAGARVVVRGDDGIAAHLAELGLAASVERIPTDAPLPAGRRVAGDALCGVAVTDRRSLGRAERALMQTCRRPYDGPGDRFVGRYLSLPITRLLARTEASPTQVTIVSASIGLLACALVALGTRGALAAGGAAFIVQLVLDSVDGELARVRHKASRRGMVLDNVTDDVLDNLYVVALGSALGGPWLWVGLGAAALRGSVAIATYRAVARAGQPGDVMAFRWWYDRGDASAAETYADYRSPVTWLRSFGRRDSYCLIFGAAALAGAPLVGLALGVVNAVGYGVLMAVHLARAGA